MKVKIRRVWDKDITEYGFKELGYGDYDSYSEVELNTIDDLGKLQDEIEHELIFRPSNEPYEYEIEIYDDYRE